MVTDIKQREMLKYAKFELVLYGPLQFFRPDGSLATPNSAKTQGLLAILAVAAGDPIERSTLQDHLWSDRMQVQGRASLRKALSELRSSIGPESSEILQSSSSRIFLNMSRIQCYFEPPNELAKLRKPEFLEGLDIKDPVFNDWLQTMRARLVAATGSQSQFSADTNHQPSLDIQSSLPERAKEFRPRPKFPQGSYCLELYPAITADQQTNFVCDALSDDVATNLRDLCSATIIDHRNLSSALPSDVEACSGLALQIGAVSSASRLHLQFRVWDSETKHLLWSQALDLDLEHQFDRTNPQRASLVSEVTERILFFMRSMGKITRLPGAPYKALSMLMNNVSGAERKVGRFLSTAQEQSNDPVYRALAAYHETLSVGESNSIVSCDVREKVQSIVHRSLGKGKFDSTYLTTAGYALHYLAADHDLAPELLMRSTETAPCQAMCWDHLALFFFDKGEFARARKASTRALSLSTHSPFRFAYETTRAMIAHAEGDHATAILFGKRALERRPGFSAALRYTTASLALSGKVEEATDLARELMKFFPEFRAGRQTQGLARAGKNNIAIQLRDGLLLAGIQL